MGSLSLYNLLVGYFTTEGAEPVDAAGDGFRRLSEEQKLHQSIIENLSMVLRTRQGSISHLPDFGLPDFMQVYLESGNSFDPLRKMIRDVILKYEPRIEDVRIDKPQFDKDNARLFLKLIVTIKDFSGTEILLTEFSTTGWVRVEFERNPT